MLQAMQEEEAKAKCLQIVVKLHAHTHSKEEAVGEEQTCWQEVQWWVQIRIVSHQLSLI